MIVVAIASIAGGVFALARSSPSPQAATTAARGDEGVGAALEVGTRVTATSSPRNEPRVVAIAAGTADGAAGDPVAALRSGLASEDEATRIAAVEAAVSATSIETLGELARFDLRRDPEAAPTVIHAVALLGASADGKKRDDAADTLARWLRDEMKREGPDVPGNVSNLVEALGNVGGSGAASELARALDGQGLPLHVETLAVMKLGELGDGTARPAVERFADRVAALPPAEGIDDELRVEAISAARTTLSRI
ncbi:MAG: hypothetical protein KF764_25270 [Labilithrix sp.]|nr:hypothetical protein [Labilithrix sp.]